MADSNASELDALKAEFLNLRKQIEGIIKNAEGKKTEVSNEVLEKLGKELEELRKNAGAHAHKLYAAGQNGLDEVEEHVRHNPLLSLAIAFGAGCVISCLVRHLR